MSDLCNASKSLDDIKESLSCIQHVRKYGKRIEENAMECVRDLLSSEQKFQANKAEVEIVNDIHDKISRLNSKLDKNTESQESIHRRQQSSTDVMESLAAQQNVLKTEKEEMQSTLHEHENLLSVYRLYNNITHTTLSLSADGNTYKGYISKKNDVKPFMLSRDDSSAFHITNHLWDLIDEP